MPSSEYPSNLGNPFTLGVASGDPSPDGVVLWTCLAPDPLIGGGMDGQGDVWVDWEVAADGEFTNIVQTSREHPTAAVKVRAVAETRLAHSVHLEVEGLESRQEKGSPQHQPAPKNILTTCANRDKRHQTCPQV
jgi:alkaline phosphatase D